METVKIPSAYDYCCEHGHYLIEDARYGKAPSHYICTQCGLTADQIQKLTIGDGVPIKDED